MIGMLSSPKLFFSDKANEKFNLRISFFIVLTNLLIGGLISVVGLNKILDYAPLQSPKFLMLGSAVVISLIVLGGLAFWALQTASIHVSALLMGGEGNYRKLLELIGYAQLPLIFSSVVALVVILLFTPTIDLLAYSSTKEIEQTLKSIPAFKFSKITGRFALFWSLYLSFIAVREVHRISNKKAALSVLIPVLLYVGFTEFLKKWLGVD